MPPGAKEPELKGLSANVPFVTRPPRICDNGVKQKSRRIRIFQKQPPYSVQNAALWDKGFANFLVLVGYIATKKGESGNEATCTFPTNLQKPLKVVV
jgi:hypothetical protein